VVLEQVGSCCDPVPLGRVYWPRTTIEPVQRFDYPESLRSRAMEVLEIDGSRYSGSGTIVRQAVALAALTNRPIRVVNVRVKRPNPGLRPQHVQVIEAIRQLVDGRTEGVQQGSGEFVFWPGQLQPRRRYVWDIGSAGSTVLLALAVLPVAAFSGVPLRAEIRGGLFQDFAPSFFHLRDVVLPVLRRMGFQVSVHMVRPGYVPQGGGILELEVEPVVGPLQPVRLERAGTVQSITGIALASHLRERSVARRMAQAAQRVLERRGLKARIELVDDERAVQPGAALALFADLESGARLGADWAGAKGRSAEAIGERVAKDLLEDLDSGATVDRHAADQLIPFAALASGTSCYRVPKLTDHIQSNAWLVSKFLGAKVILDDAWVSVEGVGFSRS